MKHRIGPAIGLASTLAVVGIALAAVVGVPPTPAPGAANAGDRAQYIDRVEPICKRNTEANTRILRGVRTKIKKGRLRPAARQFARAARAFDRTLRAVRQVQRPLEDRAVLADWLKLLKHQSRYLHQISKALKRSSKFRAQRLSVLLLRNARRANSTVFDFELRDCRLRPGKFL